MLHRWLNQRPDTPAPFGLGPVVAMRLTSETLAASIGAERRVAFVDDEGAAIELAEEI